MTKTKRPRRNPHARPDLPRRLVLADVENLAGSGDPSLCEVVQVRQDVLCLLADSRQILLHIACSHHAAQAVRFGWPEGHHWWRSGRDGADMALLESVSDRLLLQFDELIVGSGDGIFAQLAAQAASLGLRVIAVSRPEALSARLRLAVEEVRYIPPYVEVSARAA